MGVKKMASAEAKTKKGEWMATHARTLEYVATKICIEEPGKPKKIFWKPSLGNVRTTDLSLYRHSNAQIWRKDHIVVICEGEPTTDALANLEIDLGVVVVGTVTGPNFIPEDAALDFLVGRTVLLWPDNDEQGCRHMTKIATRLHDLGAKKIGMIRWPDAPDGGDATDAITSGVDIGELIAIGLNQRWHPEQFDLAGLLDRTVSAIRRFLVLDEHQLDALVLWIAHTHAFGAAEVTAYINISSAEKGSGKTRLLEVLQRLVAKPYPSSHVTPSVLVRRIARDTPTVLLDEIDALFKSGKENMEHIRGILNAGYARGGTISLSVPDGKDWEPKDYDVFAAKAFAGIGNRLPDTVRDRSILIEMRRRSPNEDCERFSHRKSPPVLKPIHDEFDVWASGAVPILTDAEPYLPGELSDRAADVWEALLAIADLAGGDWPNRSRTAALALSAGVNVEDASLGVMLLKDIKSILDSSDEDTILTADLLVELLAMVESPWGDLRGKAIDNRRLAKELRPYGIKPKDIKVSTSENTVKKGYRREDFVDAWQRYIPANATAATAATDAVPEPEKVAAVAAVADTSGGAEDELWDFNHLPS